jgi:VanW like protein/Glycosyl transferases group 1
MAQWGSPTRRSVALFRIKVVLHQVKRGVQDICAGLRRFASSDEPGFPVLLGESRTPLWADVPLGERVYQFGKVHNLRRAVRQLDRVVVPAGAVFSFWRQVGRASRGHGFVVGRMLQGGCLIPAVGGGLCQLSNALYDVALRAGCDIVERHAHSRILPGTPSGRDATVAWNYVDLRFRCRQKLQIEARIDRRELVVRFRGRIGAAGQRQAPILLPQPGSRSPVHAGDAARSCATCGETSCFRHEHSEAGAGDRTAFLVDENWPEFQTYVGRERSKRDVLGLPLDGMRWHLARYRWNTEGFSRVGSAPVQAVARALAVRRLPMQGAARRTAELTGAERVGTTLSRLLTFDVGRVCVAQSLLPFLWREGHLAGREVRVLMTRLPMAELQARLDRAWAAHPERETLHDFRAPQWLIEAETEALDYAVSIATPHNELARLFADKAVRLDWRAPPIAAVSRAAPKLRRIAFPGPTIARKGAYELREAARALDLEIVLLGGELEGPDFWDGLKTRRSAPEWLNAVAAVVQPAIVEDQPRRLLTALAAGVPVIATTACGIAEQGLLTIIPENDVPALIGALRALID